MSANINVVVLEGNLTKDPELRTLPSGTSICKCRLAVNSRAKVNDEWTEEPNYFDVTVWGRQGEVVAEHMSKGSGLMVDGRLKWREWETDDGGKRQAIEIIANNVRFIGKKGGGQNVGGGQAASGEENQAATAPADTTDLPASGDAGGDGDIPF